MQWDKLWYNFPVYLHEVILENELFAGDGRKCKLVLCEVISDCFTILFLKGQYQITYWLKETAVQHTLPLLLAVTPSGDNRTVARTGQMILWKYLHGYTCSCIPWSTLLNHLTDRVSFSLHCCWCCFVLSKTLLPVGLSTQSVWPV